MSKPILVVKVGSDNRPATKEDLEDVEKQIKKALEDPDPILVTHHNIEFQYVYKPE